MTQAKFYNDTVLLFNKHYPGQDLVMDEDVELFVATCTNQWRDRLFTDLLLVVKGACPPPTVEKALRIAWLDMKEEALSLCA